MEESIIVVNNEFHNLPFSEKEELMKKQLIEIKNEIFQMTQSEVDTIVSGSRPRPANPFLNFFGSFLSNLIGNIPVVGPLAGAVFSTIWDLIFTKDDSKPGMPPQPRFLTDQEFKDYMEEFRRDMERIIDQRIDDLIIATCNSYLLDLKNVCDRWHEVIAWYEEEMGQGRHKSKNLENVPGYLKKSLPKGSEQFNSWELSAIRAEIVNRHGRCIIEMNRCMNYFTTVGGGIQNRQLMAGHVIQTCSFYIMIQRDVFFKGSDWGFVRQQINVIPGEISLFIDRAFNSFASAAMPNFKAGTFLSKYNTPELYNIYSTFAYLDLVRFPVTGKKLDVNPSNNTVVIPREFDDNRIKIVVNQYGALKEIPVTPILPQGILMEGVYDCDNWSAHSFRYTVRRPSRPFTRVTIRVANTGGIYAPYLRLFINGQRVSHVISSVKDMYFYNGSQSVYTSVTQTFNTPTTEFTVQLEGTISSEFSNHTLLEFEQ
ncbi:hypothetical protein RB653_006215 [Dictyostelium firmibasis]|uniref:Pesticidal crystal protein N-terminal domain-containing protein n=1 Tax=Dictyostelium firmibasis TaxID=79012 RepID=A0AAN7YZZ9_9MYCE